MGWFPCCSSASRCSKFTDAFDRSLDPHWAQPAGLWSLHGGRLTTPSSDALIVCDSTPAANAAMAVEATIPTLFDEDKEGAQYQLVTNYDDDTGNRLFAQIELQHGRRSALVSLWENDQELARATLNTVGLGSTFRVCYDPAIRRLAVAVPDFTSSLLHAKTSAQPTGRKGGLGVAAAVGEAAFDDFKLHDLVGGCQCGWTGCGCFPPYNGPRDTRYEARFQVEISGLANRGCDQCANYNKIYVARGVPWGCTYEWVSNSDGFDPHPCDLFNPGIGAEYGLYFFTSHVHLGGQGEFWVARVHLEFSAMANYGGTVIWEKRYDSPPDCFSFQEEEIPWVTNGFVGCDGEPATCKVTFLEIFDYGEP